MTRMRHGFSQKKLDIIYTNQSVKIRVLSVSSVAQNEHQHT